MSWSGAEPSPSSQSPWYAAPFLFGRRILAERKLKRRGILFRAFDPLVSASAYASMNSSEFAHINACQKWANWRTLPKLLSKVETSGAWKIVDLGCGHGYSTEVLSWYSPEGSRLIGYDLAVSSLKIARGRTYFHSSGRVADVVFRSQPIDETWLDCDGHIISDRSITLVNASGIVGHHLSLDRLQLVVREIRRVLMPHGWALLDVGPRISRDDLAEVMRSFEFQFVCHCRSCWLDPYGQSAFRL